MYVIGTAGHVDHGKSTLVQALTGIDPDRLREEKERGLTIDLGFAWLTLPDGREVSIVDVPGHERFVHNMLAGAGGVDLALLVVAADEGVMPQTREHLSILDLLGVGHGVVALTKRDLVDEEMAELVALDLRDTLAGTALAEAPIVACSGVTRQGLDDILAALVAALDQTPRKRDLGRPRLPIDRVFTMSGFGTVVTGTLIDGALTVGDTVELAPGGPSASSAHGLRARIRGLQSHRTKTEVAEPGWRVAANLSGVSPEDVARGMTLTTPGWLRPTTALDLRMRTVRELPHRLRHNTTVTFHSGTTEVAGTLRLLDADDLGPGDEAWAQVRLSRGVAVVRGDRCVLRVAGETVGGGVIVEAYAPRRRRNHPPTLRALTAGGGGPEDAVLGAATARPFALVSELAARLDLSADAVVDATRALVTAGRVVALPHDREPNLTSALVAAETAGAWAGRITSALAQYHEAHPLRPGMPKEELRTKLGIEARPFAALLALFTARKLLREQGAGLSMAGFAPALSASQEEEAALLIASLRERPFSPPTDRLPGPELLALLAARGQIVVVGDGIAFDSEAHRRMVEGIVARIREQGAVTLADVRDAFGTSRRYAQAVLEDLDRRRVTRRVGDSRVLAEPAETPT